MFILIFINFFISVLDSINDGDGDAVVSPWTDVTLEAVPAPPTTKPASMSGSSRPPLPSSVLKAFDQADMCADQADMCADQASTQPTKPQGKHATKRFAMTTTTMMVIMIMMMVMMMAPGGSTIHWSSYHQRTRARARVGR